MNREEKRALRQIFLARRSAIGVDVRPDADRKIREAIMRSPVYRAMRCVALFATDGLEPDLLPLMEMDREKVFVLPRYVAERKCYELAVVRDCAADLVRARYGLLEPASEGRTLESELVERETLHLVPGVAFDDAGVRLGRGGGFYDRLLERVVSPVWGVYYACQHADRMLPEERHDRRLDGVFTENEVLDFRT